MTMLFAIECPTCSRRLQVRKKSAIGQIVNCPACGSMMQLNPPPGWVPPSDHAPEKSAPADTPSKPAAAPSASVAQARAPSASPNALPTPDQLMASQSEAPGFPWDKVILAGSIITAIATLGIGLWIVLGDAKKPVIADATPAASGESSTETTGPVSTAASPAPTSEATVEPTPAATAEATGAVPSATPEVAPEGTAAAPAMPAETPAEPMPPAPSETPEPMTPAEPPMPRAPLPAVADVDVPARMADPIAKVEFSGLPLAQAVEFVAEMSGLSITLDLDGIAQAGATPKDPVSAKLKATTVGDLLETILSQRNLAYVVEAGRLRVTARSAQADEFITVDFDVADLTNRDLSNTEHLAAMIRALVTPGVWDQDDKVKLAVKPGLISITQRVKACQPASEFLDKLRMARGQPLTSSPVATPRSVLATRLSRARDKLMKKNLLNFKDERLEEILKRFERETEMNILIDSLALAQVGVATDAKATLSAVQDEPTWSALERLLEPLSLGYRVVDGQTLQVTSRNALVEQFDLEVYKILDLVPEKFPLEEFLLRLKSHVEPGTWGEFGPGAVVYDDFSGAIFVRHHQIAHGQIEDWLYTLRAPVKKGDPVENKAEPKRRETPRAANAPKT